MYLSGILILLFLINSIGPFPEAQAEDFRLPAPGVMIPLSPTFNPPILKGLKINPENPFRFDFILDVGDGSKPSLNGRVMNPPLQDESIRLIKYFLASLTIPENDLWVNLSPYEKDRIIPHSFGLTEMGRDLLAEDYMLKQITASLIYPEGETGKKFWNRIYQEAQKRYGTTNVPVNTFNKVWIVPDKAVVYENPKAGTAYVVESKLKVMLEEDYLSMQKHLNNNLSFPNASVGNPENVQILDPRLKHSGVTDISSLGSQIIRQIVIPELTKEVNQGQNFAQLRQVYNSLILATWYKKKIKDSILAQVYENKDKVKGLSSPSASTRNPEQIYQQYLKAFKKGVYNYIKEDFDPVTQENVPKKYFSGGVSLAMTTLNSSTTFRITPTEPTNLSSSGDYLVQMRADPALVAQDGSQVIIAVGDIVKSTASGTRRRILSINGDQVMVETYKGGAIFHEYMSLQGLGKMISLGHANLIKALRAKTQRVYNILDELTPQTKARMAARERVYQGFLDEPVVELNKVELAKAFFNKVLESSSAEYEIHAVLMNRYGFSSLRAQEMIQIIKEGRIDDIGQGYSTNDRRVLYEVIFTDKAKIWKGANGSLRARTFVDMVLGPEGFKKIFFEKAGHTDVEVFFAINKEDFISQIVRQEEKIYGRAYGENEISLIRNTFVTARGINIPFRNRNGQVASKIVINIEQVSFSSVLQTAIHEFSHNGIDEFTNGKGWRVLTADNRFVNEGLAEVFSIYVYRQLWDLYNNKGFLQMYKRQVSDTISGKIWYVPYRSRFLFVDSLRKLFGISKVSIIQYYSAFIFLDSFRKLVGMSKFSTIVFPEIVKVYTGKSSVRQLSKLMDTYDQAMINNTDDQLNIDELGRRLILKPDRMTFFLYLDGKKLSPVKNFNRGSAHAIFIYKEKYVIRINFTKNNTFQGERLIAQIGRGPKVYGVGITRDGFPFAVMDRIYLTQTVSRDADIALTEDQKGLVRSTLETILENNILAPDIAVEDQFIIGHLYGQTQADDLAWFIDGDQAKVFAGDRLSLLKEYSMKWDLRKVSLVYGYFDQKLAVEEMRNPDSPAMVGHADLRDKAMMVDDVIKTLTYPYDQYSKEHFDRIPRAIEIVENAYLIMPKKEFQLEFESLCEKIVQRIKENKDSEKWLANRMEYFLIGIKSSRVVADAIGFMANNFEQFLIEQRFANMFIEMGVEGKKKDIVQAINEAVKQKRLGHHFSSKKIINDLVSKLMLDHVHIKFVRHGEKIIESETGLAIEMAAISLINDYIRENYSSDYAYMLFVILWKILESPEIVQLEDGAFGDGVATCMSIWLDNRENKKASPIDLVDLVKGFSRNIFNDELDEPKDLRFREWVEQSKAMTAGVGFRDGAMRVNKVRIIREAIVGEFSEVEFLSNGDLALHMEDGLKRLSSNRLLALRMMFKDMVSSIEYILKDSGSFKGKQIVIISPALVREKDNGFSADLLEPVQEFLNALNIRGETFKQSIFTTYKDYYTHKLRYGKLWNLAPRRWVGRFVVSLENRKDLIRKIEVYKSEHKIFVQKTGGIDLRPMNLNVGDGNGMGIKFHLSPAMLAQLQNAAGFVPVIINIQPVSNLRRFLGLEKVSSAPKISTY